MRYFWTVFTFLFLFVTTALDAKTSPLFIIARSKNANVIHYDANLSSNGKIDPRKPVTAYWVLLARDGRRQELSALDKKAYGYHCQFDKKSRTYKLVIESFSSRVIRISSEKNKIRSEIVINGRPAWLEKIFIDEREAIFVPKVQYLELFGKDKVTGNDLHEKIPV